MSQASHTVSGGPSGMAPKTGRNAIIAAGLVVAGLSGFFYSLKRGDELRRERGNLHQYEHTLAQRRNEGYFSDPWTSVSAERRVPLPVKEHNAQHNTISRVLEKGSSWKDHIHQPAPQRDRGDGSGHVYTKKTT